MSTKASEVKYVDCPACLQNLDAGIALYLSGDMQGHFVCGKGHSGHEADSRGISSRVVGCFLIGQGDCTIHGGSVLRDGNLIRIQVSGYHIAVEFHRDSIHVGVRCFHFGQSVSEQRNVDI